MFHVLVDWFDPIHSGDVIFSVAVTDGCLPTSEILSIAAEEDPAGAYLTGLSPLADTGQFTVSPALSPCCSICTSLPFQLQLLTHPHSVVGDNLHSVLHEFALY